MGRRRRREWNDGDREYKINENTRRIKKTGGMEEWNKRGTWD